MLKAKVSTVQIAAVIGCSKRTIYREKQRGLCEQLNHRTSKTYMIYSAQKSQNRADQMRDLHKGRPVKLCPQLAAHLEDYIGKRHYSPAAAVRRSCCKVWHYRKFPPTRPTDTSTGDTSACAAWTCRSAATS